MEILSLTILSLWTTICTCLEETERAIYLQPRDFNPHPLQAGFRAGLRSNLENRGPVLFPETPPDSSESDGNSRPITAVPDNRLPIDRHPYASVVRRNKYKQSGRFQEGTAGPHALKALADHAKKVLNQATAPEDDPYSHLKNYAFAYKVKDHLSGDDFSHVQEQKSGATNGEYRVKLPDGRVQIVSYVADKDGYKAEVKYALDSNTKPITSNNQQSNYEYDYEDQLNLAPVYYQQQQQPQVELYHPQVVVSSTARPAIQVYPQEEDPGLTQGYLHDRNLVQGVVVTTSQGASPPTPVEESQLQINPYLVVHNNIHEQPEQQKVQLFENIHDQKVRAGLGKVVGFISSTLAPFVDTKGFQNVVVSSTLAPPPQHHHYQVNPVHLANHRYQQQSNDLYYKK